MHHRGPSSQREVNGEIRDNLIPAEVPSNSSASSAPPVRRSTPPPCCGKQRQLILPQRAGKVAIEIPAITTCSTGYACCLQATRHCARFSTRPSRFATFQASPGGYQVSVMFLVTCRRRIAALVMANPRPRRRDSMVAILFEGGAVRRGCLIQSPPGNHSMHQHHPA